MICGDVSRMAEMIEIDSAMRPAPLRAIRSHLFSET